MGLEREILNGPHGDDRRRDGRAVDAEPVGARAHEMVGSDEECWVATVGGKCTRSDNRRAVLGQSVDKRGWSTTHEPKAVQRASGPERLRGENAQVLLVVSAGASGLPGQVRTGRTRRQRSR